MNTEENVVKMPDRLERLAKRIITVLARDSKIREEWIEIQLEKAEALAVARAEFNTRDREFGKWCTAEGFGEDVLARDYRAALIHFGNDLPRARAILEKTDRWSVLTIYRTEWMARSVSIHPPRINKVEAVAEALKTETGDWPDKKTLATVADVHPRSADNALRTVKAVEEATGAIAEVKYTKAQDHHVEARIRAATKELEKAAQAREALFWERVTQEANASCEKRFPNLQERENDVVRAERHWRTVANNHKPIFSEAEYRDLLLCTHEANPSDETKKRAFMALNAKKLQLTGKK